ncbi:unnamed protein product [Orchesella dallaii]|uniref:Ima1 N-terminal domain-containing protein n=1 Tax=Orchesella dallaii TaxID=48710 RepID=A0ABP1QQR3_9HEXA
MTNSSSIMERLLDPENLKNLAAGLNAILTCFYEHLESWYAVAEPWFDSSLNKFGNCREWLTKQIKLPGWEYLEGGYSAQEMFSVAFVTVFIVFLPFICFKVYKMIRNKWQARVNCWHCSKNTWVSYSLQDTWTCPNCGQYNGFAEDGDYNQRLPAQSIELLNYPIRGRPAEGYHMERNSNGLCSRCNIFQVLKVYLLASFKAVNERNYDAEIEAEQERLEKEYEICAPCKLVVEEALKRVSNMQQLTAPQPESSDVVSIRGSLNLLEIK